MKLAASEVWSKMITVSVIVLYFIDPGGTNFKSKHKKIKHKEL